MIYVFDTNILVHLIRQTAGIQTMLTSIGVFQPKNHMVISIVSAAEIRSFAYRNRWGVLRLNALQSFLNAVTSISIDNQNLVDSYMEIDAFSQGKHHIHALPVGMTARNMGKNDVWIAATTHVAKATLITTDADFEHLDPLFFKVVKIKI
jgi:predicted nucleic acid-binding protein